MLTTNHPQQTPTATGARSVGQRVELGRYRISAGQRVLYGQRIGGVVRVMDRPCGAGRSYLVERELERDGHAAVRALVKDYIRESERRDQPAILTNLHQLADGL